MEPQHPVVGGNLSVTCLTDVKLTDLWDHGIDLVMNSPEIINLADRVEISDKKIRKGWDANHRVIERFDFLDCLLS